MKAALFFALLSAAAAPILLSGVAVQDRGPLEGTWVGEASSDGSRTKLVLEIANEKGVLSGTLRRDPDGADDSFDLEDLEFKNGKLFFTYSGTEGLYDMTSVELKLDGDKLEGVWRDANGRSGPAKFTRKVSP